MTFEEYRSYDALGLASLVAKQEIQATELLDLAISRMEQVNPFLNAVVYNSRSYAHKMAAQLPEEGVFKGVPLLIKDFGLNIQDYPLWNGCRGFDGIMGQVDSHVIHNLRKAGGLFIGRSHSPEFALLPVADSELWGNCRNPWGEGLDPGGSSGGSAAAISSGIVPLASASDVGGSIRIPSASCGLFGFKPSKGQVPLEDTYGDMAGGALVENCISRSVRDSAAYLQVISKKQKGAVAPLNALPIDFLSQIERPPKKLRIGFTCQNALGNPVHPTCVQAVGFAVRHLTDLGHNVEEVPIPYSSDFLTEVHLDMVFYETAALIKQLPALWGRPLRRSDMGRNARVMAAMGNLISPESYSQSKNRWKEASSQMEGFHKKYDILLTPTLAVPQFQIGEFQSSRSEEMALDLLSLLKLERIFKNKILQTIRKGVEKTPFTQIANLTGQPAMNVPLFWTPKELPVGVMMTGAVGSDLLLFQLARQLERAVPWFEKVPSDS